jgi:hypothetical protein
MSAGVKSSLARTSAPRSGAIPLQNQPRPNLRTLRPGRRLAPSSGSNAATPVPAARKPTGKRKRSSRHSSASGPTASPIQPAPTAPKPSPATSAGTTDTDHTARSEASPRSAASHRSVGPTTSWTQPPGSSAGSRPSAPRPRRFRPYGPRGRALATGESLEILPAERSPNDLVLGGLALVGIPDPHAAARRRATPFGVS